MDSSSWPRCCCPKRRTVASRPCPLKPHRASARPRMSDLSMTPSFHSTLADAQWLASTPAAIEAIDSHAHVFVRGLPLAPHRRHAPDYDATLDAYTGHLRAKGLSHAVLVQPSFLGTDNAFFLDVLQRYPRRFRGVVVIDPSIS